MAIEKGLIQESVQNHSYTFRHSSFLHYAAAQFLCTLSTDQLQQRVKAYRDDSFYHLTLRLLSGLLSIKEPTKLSPFFKALVDDYSTWAGERITPRLKLILSCLDECQPDFPKDRTLLGEALRDHSNSIAELFLENFLCHPMTLQLLAVLCSHPSEAHSNLKVAFGCFAIACGTGNLTLAKFLYETFPSVMDRGYLDWIPIHLAALEGRLNIIQWLHSIKPSLLETHKDNNVDSNYTPLEAAAKKGHLEVVKWISTQLKEGEIVKMKEEEIVKSVILAPQRTVKPLL
jgi:hypothetical protein